MGSPAMLPALLGLGGPLCPGVEGLAELVACMANTMPAAGTHAFQGPDRAQYEAWGQAVEAMLAGSCAPPALEGVSTRTLVDTANGTYHCALVDDLDANADGRADRGWGMVVVADDPALSLHVQVPHPRADIGTDREGLALYRALGARSLEIAGAHRDSGALGTCQGSPTSDPAHDAAHPFQAATEAISHTEVDQDFLVIQLHGKAATSCPTLDLYLSGGLPTRSGPAWELGQRLGMEHPTLRVGVAGDGQPCELIAGRNVQGRLLNAAPGPVCTTAAARASGHFIHIEQGPGFRDGEGLIDALRAIADPFPGSVANAVDLWRGGTVQR